MGLCKFNGDKKVYECAILFDYLKFFCSYKSLLSLSLFKVIIDLGFPIPYFFTGCLPNFQYHSSTVSKNYQILHLHKVLSVVVIIHSSSIYNQKVYLLLMAYSKNISSMIHKSMNVEVTLLSRKMCTDQLLFARYYAM